MSVAAVKTYARTRMHALGYKEWTDGFNFQNIPATLLDTRFAVELGNPSTLKISNDNQELSVPFTVRAFVKPTKDPKALIDRGAAKIDTIVTDFVKPAHATTGEEVKNVEFLDGKVLPLADSNDNGIITEINFKALVIVSTL